MKKLLLLTVGLLVLAAPVAMADSMNLAWGTCRTAANNANALVNNRAVANPLDCSDPANLFGTLRLTCSFKNSTPMVSWQGTRVRVDILTAGPLSPWWELAPGGCREGAITGPATMVNGLNCTNPYTLAPTDPAGQGDLSGVAMDIAAGRVRVVADHIRNSTGVDLPVPASLGGYTANNLGLVDAGTVDCGGGLGTGCEQPASIALNALRYQDSNSTDVRDISTYELNGCVTWGGGAGGGCPGAVPTHNVTWGHVKQLYR